METLVILISGRGSNMQALLEAGLPINRVVVISNDPDAEGLKIAASLGALVACIDHRNFQSREAFDAALADEIDRHQPDLIALAGFMRILTDGFVLRYQGRLLNIHPSLLPAYPGLQTHRRALQDGVKIHGCTVHFVTAAVDHGPIVIQAAVPVMPDDTPQILASRVLQAEHRIYPQAVRWFFQERLKLSGQMVTVSRAVVHDSVIYSPGLQD
ncbi:MAG: phosphoribosylglycinamide formyltransferase [Nitrosomonas sp.]|nr:phosphoribosylglycinamide formyltransferase [Burkholderiales bacterium]MCP5252724.1 phosphoribosylglycinamide formyltransferase [Burkholderiales bacterium]MCP5291038.1 phosphoribosylglycinamide formyltransferase [Burkholderiales bacterium]MDR4519506.1 phosphoribosylglycinamide formyltransferase [Nitrosomonas sp.]